MKIFVIGACFLFSLRVQAQMITVVVNANPFSGMSEHGVLLEGPVLPEAVIRADPHHRACQDKGRPQAMPRGPIKETYKAH